MDSVCAPQRDVDRVDDVHCNTLDQIISPRQLQVRVAVWKFRRWFLEVDDIHFGEVCSDEWPTEAAGSADRTALQTRLRVGVRIPLY